MSSLSCCMKSWFNVVIVIHKLTLKVKMTQNISFHRWARSVSSCEECFVYGWDREKEQKILFCLFA